LFLLLLQKPHTYNCLLPGGSGEVKIGGIT